MCIFLLTIIYHHVVQGLKFSPDLKNILGATAEHIIFGFNYGEMPWMLGMPPEKFKDKLYNSIQAYLTILRKELGYVPDRERVKNILISGCKTRGYSEGNDG